MDPGSEVSSGACLLSSRGWSPNAFRVLRLIKLRSGRRTHPACNLDCTVSLAMSDGSSNQPTEVGTLTAAQRVAVSRLSRLFLERPGPQIVRLSGPEHRGKTYVVQQLLGSMVSASLAPGTPQPVLPWSTESDWRLTRARLAMPTELIRTSMGWWWTAMSAVPDVPNDILGSLRRNAIDLLSAEDFPAAEHLGVSEEDWWKLAAKTTLSVGLDRIPFFGVGAAFARAGRESLRMRSNDSQTIASELTSELRPHLASDLLLALAIARFASPSSELPAIPPLMMVVDQANNLSAAEQEQLEQVLTLNPEELLAATHLPDSAQRSLKALALPPAFPITVVLIEDTTTAGQSFRGPFGRRQNTDKPEPTRLAGWCAEMSQARHLPVTIIEDFPLATTSEASAVVSSFLPRLSDSDRNAVVARSMDHYLEGHNIALVRAHVQRISLLSNLEDLSSRWIEANLPPHLEAEITALAGEVSVDSRRALVAGSLLGFGFTHMGVIELLGEDLSEVLEEAVAVGLVSIQGREDGLPIYVFGDHMTYQYFRNLGLADQSLCRSTLTGSALAKARMILSWAYPSDSTEALKVAEIAKGACWEYRELAEEAGLTAEAEQATDIWGAALALSGDRDMIYASGGDADARRRLDFLYDIRDRSRSDDHDIHAWACIRRWHVHRLTPGAMSYGSILSMVQSGQTDENPTRTIPEAHQAAADLVARHFSEYPDGYTFGWFDAQLAYRLGPYIRRMETSVALEAASRLLYAGMSSATATHYVASELWDVLRPPGRLLCVKQLKHWSEHGDADDPVRSAALLVFRVVESPTKATLDLLCDAFASKTSDNLFRDFEVNGPLGDLSAPRVYPWKGLDVTVACALVTASRSTAVGIGRGKLLHRLLSLAEQHPSAAAIIESDFTGDLSHKRRRRIDEVEAHWRLTGLVGHSEQGPLPVLESLS